MVATIPFNPFSTTVGQGLFGKTSYGLVQGTAYPDPAIRYKLAQGTLSQSETLPMWGGVGIYTDLGGASGGPIQALGTIIGRASSLTNLLGFSVFDQNYAMVNTPQSPVPLIGSGGQVNYYRLGSGARIAVSADASLVSLQGGLTNAQVSWDFVAQKLVPFSAEHSSVAITGATWASTGGGQTTFTVGTDLTSDLSAGDDIDVSGVVSTGGTGAGYNGNFIVVSVDSTHVVVSQASPSSPGTYSSGGTIAGFGGALPVQILDIQASNCQIVDYSSPNATWDYDGAAAVILI
jgi:hypothetical protein